MRKAIVGIGLILIALFALLVNGSPDTLSLFIVALMGVIAMLGFLFGMVPLAMYVQGFHNGNENIDHVLEVQTSSTWLSVQQIDGFFRQRRLDQMFEEYINKVRVQSKEGRIVSDLEEMINEESIALRSWQSVIVQIPNTLTSLGLLGTFVGLITGISTIGFSSVEAALSSIEVLLSGIRTAFFTSIAGVILSIFFNMTYKLVWNVMVRELGLFMENFHLHIMPSVEEQERNWQYAYNTKVLELLERLPKDKGFSLGNTPQAAAAPNAANEQRMMGEIQESLQNGEFIFYIQPRVQLATRKIIGGEALMRWNHKDMGLVSPAVFLPIVERNGFIVKIDRYIWEEVCKTIRRWIDEGVRPVPMSINISQTDILAMDVALFFDEMMRKYRIPPRYLEVEIAQNAYLQHEAATRSLEDQLRQKGLRVVVDGFNGDFMAMHLFKKTEADALKLDLRFIGDGGKESQIIGSIYERANALQLTIVAEGIENAEQFTALRRAGCEEGQGFYLHKPLPIEEFEKIAKSSKD